MESSSYPLKGGKGRGCLKVESPFLYYLCFLRVDFLKILVYGLLGKVIQELIFYVNFEFKEGRDNFV